MRQIKEILRLKYRLGRSHREIARGVGRSTGAVGETIQRARDAGLAVWEEIERLSETELEGRLYVQPAAVPGRALPDPAYLHTELWRKGVTLQLLHVEYLESHPDGYRYTQFCEHYRRWARRQRPTMRQVHRAGEKLFVDYSGKKPEVVDPRTGEVREVELFVAVLGASNFTYAEATETQQSPDWIASHVRALAYLSGVPEALVPDQLKSGVAHPGRYEPVIQRTYAELAEHYDTVVLPARPGKSRDKAKVEACVLVAQRWILARLRNQTFFSLGALNARIAELLDELNDRVMKVYGESRRALFERLDRPVLKALPARPFVYGEWLQAKVNIDYHVEVDRHYYSVPHALLGEYVDVRKSAATVEIFFRGRRVTSHARSRLRGHPTTKTEHMPKAHREHAEWSPSRLIRWGEKIGPATGALIEAILKSRRHPEQGYRSCLGILRLEKRYGRERLEIACERAVEVQARSYRHVDAILKNGLDRLPPREQKTTPLPGPHENVRGPGYYEGEPEC